MTDALQQAAPSGPAPLETKPDGKPFTLSVRIAPPRKQLDLATILGLVFAIVLISAAIYMGHSNANFFDVPSVLIVILGTASVTCISYTGEDIKRAGKVIGHSVVRTIRSPATMARQLMDIAVMAKKKGLLTLTTIETELRKDPLIAKSVLLVTDGYTGDDIDRILNQEIESVIERHKRSASILRRASEIAPAMGLIGTLVGLVQMLADLSNPEAIGPAMAVALLTTFYGAILGSVVLAPMAAKLDRNSNDEILYRTLVLSTMASIARQENPRKLENILNSALPPRERITYFE